MARILLIGTLPSSLVNFRGALIREIVHAGHDVISMAEPATDPIRSDIEALGAVYRSFPVRRSGLSPRQDFLTYCALKRALQELQPDVVLAYTIKPVVWGGLALRTIPGARFYALITGLGFAFQNVDIVRKVLTALVTQLYRVSLKRASRVIFQNRDNRDEFVARKIIPRNGCAVVNGSGVDLSAFSNTQLPAEGSVFLMIARLLGEKGLREYAEAACLVKARYSEAVFRLVGPEDPSPDGILLAEVIQWHEQGWIEYLGETDDVRPFLADCHVYVLPSYHEGMPRTVLEAMAMGRPILTTEVPGCRETVMPGENGFLVSEGDATALAERMMWFIENRPLWQRMAARSRKMAEERFDVHSVNQSLMRIMELD
ncbi:MAG: glycosyltransferase family 4 protein [Gammaproteobacteria bacterium]|nr:glycosyltransferase family 4 protein [Gammaproteobacteria bacterium]